MTWHLICDACAKRSGEREFKCIGICRELGEKCALCGVELPAVNGPGGVRHEDGRFVPWASGHAVTDENLVEIRRYTEALRR